MDLRSFAASMSHPAPSDSARRAEAARVLDEVDAYLATALRCDGCGYVLARCSCQAPTLAEGCTHRTRAHRCPKTPCLRCGGPMWTGTGSRPAGEQMCRPCRREARRLRLQQMATCPVCASEFVPARGSASIVSTRVYCSRDCAASRHRPAARLRRPDGRPGRYRKPNPPGNTTAAGLGYKHQLERKRLLAEFAEGMPCPYAASGHCRHEDGRMWSWQRLDADDWPPRALGGGDVKRLAHARCNRSAGAHLGNLLRAGMPLQAAKWIDQLTG